MQMSTGLSDLASGFDRFPLAARLAQNELLQRYARSVLGPFWITVIQAVYASVLGLVVSALFNQSIATVLPIIVLGMMIWNFITGVALDSCQTFPANRQHLLNTDTPFSMFVHVTVLRHGLVFAHHFLAAVVVALLFGVSFGPTPWMGLLAVPPIVLAAYGIGFLVAPLAARYRDVVSLLQSVVMVGSVVTPVWWLHDFVKTRREIVEFNPLAYMIEAVRAPVLGTPPMDNALLVAWLVGASILAIGLLVFFSMRRNLAIWI